MKIKIFAIVCIGSVLILAMSSILIYTQVRTVQGINLDPLADSLYKENSKILTWILSTVPLDKIDTMKLPESWAEIFVVSNSDLQLVSSTNAAHKGVALYRHPLLLDQAAAIVNAIKNGKTTTVSARKFMIVIQPLGPEQSIVALKPKAWETAIVSRQNDQMKGTSSSILTILGAFLLVGGLIAVAIAFIITRTIAAPAGRALDALKALSLGDFDHEVGSTRNKEMTSFNESYLRLKTSLEIALDRISRR